MTRQPGLYATFHTSEGDIVCRLFETDAPKTVKNFVDLAEGKRDWKDRVSGKKGPGPLYSGTIFHRVIPDFMLQGGDPLGNGTGGESIWGGDFADEFVPTLSNIRGSIAMANRGANTNSSQFFINQADNTFLDFKHTVFGQVVSGMSVVDQIVNVKRDANDKPATDVTMQVQVFKVVK